MALNNPTGQPSNNPSSDFQGASIPNRIGYRFKDLDPGSNVYIQRDDKLVIQMMSSVTGEKINVNARILIPGRDAGRTQPSADTVDNPLGDNIQGEIIAINSMVNAANIYTIGTQIINLAEGYLLSIALSSLSTTVRGRTYARAYILRGSNTVTNVSYLLCGDYITLNTPTGFPFSSYQVPTSGRGWIRVQATAAWSAGSDPAFATGANSRCTILGFTGILTCSAAVANRIVTANVTDGTTGLTTGVFTANVALTAAQVGRVTAAPGIVASAAIALNVVIALPQPLMMLNAANSADTQEQFQITTVGKDVGDVWTNTEFITEEWLDF